MFVALIAILLESLGTPPVHYCQPRPLSCADIETHRNERTPNFYLTVLYRTTLHRMNCRGLIKRVMKQNWDEYFFLLDVFLVQRFALNSTTQCEKNKALLIVTYEVPAVYNLF